MVSKTDFRGAAKCIPPPDGQFGRDRIRVVAAGVVKRRTDVGMISARLSASSRAADQEQFICEIDALEKNMFIA